MPYITPGWWLGCSRGMRMGMMGVFGVTWLGNYLWGLAPDGQEKQIETDLTLYKHVHQNYDKYYNDSKSKDVNLVIETHKTWSVRKTSHQGIAKKVFKGLKEDKTTYALYNEGIYLENYALEGKTYKLAAYSKIEAVSLNQDIRVKSFKALRYNTFIKVGYTNDYGLIVFYDANGKMQMTLQIIGGNNPKEATLQWVNYLGLLLPSKVQETEDRENQVQDKLRFVKLYTFEKLNEIWGEKIEGTKPPIEQVIPDDMHVVQGPGECLSSCENIIKNAGYTHDELSVMVLTTNVSGNEFDFHRECVLKAGEIIDQHLESGKPIIVGVNYKDGSSNFDGVTDHWIVITARGKDDVGIFYNFFEVAKEEDLGVSKDNKLYLLPSGILKGKCTCNKNFDYQWVTMIRPLGDFTFKYCGREIYQNDSEKWGNWNKCCAECKESPGYYNKRDEKRSNAIPEP